MENQEEKEILNQRQIKIKTNISHENGNSEKEYYTYHDKMEHELNKLQSTTKREIADIHPSFDFAVIADIVQSKAEKKYFVIAELKKPTVSFIPANYIRESSTFEIGQKLKIVRKCGIGLEDIQIIPNEVDDDSYFEYNWCEGFKSTYIRGNDPNNFLYFVGGIRIDAILNGNEDFTVEDVYKKDVDEEGVNNENEEREEEVDAEFEINNDFHVFGYNIVPDVVYRRALTPRIPYDCKNRDEEFYSRDDILILWEPQEIIRLAFEDNRGSSYPMEYVIRQVPWQRIKQPISEVPDLIRDEIVVVGCFTDKDNIYFGKIPFILAKYVGFAIRNIERYCGYRLYANAFWDESTKRYLISEFHFSASFMPYLERIPGGNGNLRTTVEKSSKVGKFYKIRQNRGAYIFDRFNLVQEHIPEDFEYPIKIIKNPFYVGYTVLEIAAPDEIEPPKEWIEGQFFVATEEYLYSSEYEDAIIWYNKKNFDMECGYFYRVEAKYNDSKKRYEVYSVNFFDMDESFLEPIKTCGKICYLIRAAIEDGFIIHQIFGIIGFKPFRNIEADEPLCVTYVGDIKDSQVQFVLCEEHENLKKRFQPNFM